MVSDSLGSDGIKEVLEPLLERKSVCSCCNKIVELSVVGLIITSLWELVRGREIWENCFEISFLNIHDVLFMKSCSKGIGILTFKSGNWLKISEHNDNVLSQSFERWVVSLNNCISLVLEISADFSTSKGNRVS